MVPHLESRTRKIGLISTIFLAPFSVIQVAPFSLAFNNTGLLLKNYRKLKNHCSEIYNEVDEYQDSVLDLKELTLESLEKYRFKTAKMLKYIEAKIQAYEIDCLNGTIEEQRRFRIIHDRYLANKRLSAKELAEKYYIEQRTVYRDTDQAIKDFSIYLFGVVAIEFK